MVAYQDKLVGQLADDLEKLGLRRNTIIIFTTDNGPDGKPAGTIHGKPMVGGKGSTREGGVRQPLIVNGPGLVPKNRVCEDLGDFTDLYPTVLELAGVPRPEGLDGTSLAPQMLGRPGKPREWVYAQLGGGYFIADKQYKLYGDGTLVDITHSPVEERPVDESDAQAKAARERLSAAMKHLRGPDGDGSKPARATRKARSTTP
jgi:arylsulfatase A